MIISFVCFIIFFVSEEILEFKKNIWFQWKKIWIRMINLCVWTFFMRKQKTSTTTAITKVLLLFFSSKWTGQTNEMKSKEKKSEFPKNNKKKQKLFRIPDVQSYTHTHHTQTQRPIDRNDSWYKNLDKS